MLEQELPQMLDIPSPTIFQYVNLGLLSAILIVPLIMYLGSVESALSWIWSLFMTLQMIASFTLLKTNPTPDLILAMQPIYYITGFQVPQYNRLIEQKVFKSPVDLFDVKQNYSDLFYAR